MEGKVLKSRIRRTVLLAALFSIMNTAFVWGQDEDLYGTPEQAPVYHSIQEIRAAADTLVSGWTGAN